MNSIFKFWISNLLGGYGDEEDIEEEEQQQQQQQEDTEDGKPPSSKAPLVLVPGSPGFVAPPLRPINVPSSSSSSSSSIANRGRGGGVGGDIVVPNGVPRIVHGVMDGFTAEEYLSIIDQLKLTVREEEEKEE